MIERPPVDQNKANRLRSRGERIRISLGDLHIRSHGCCTRMIYVCKPFSLEEKYGKMLWGYHENKRFLHLSGKQSRFNATSFRHKYHENVFFNICDVSVTCKRIGSRCFLAARFRNHWTVELVGSTWDKLVSFAANSKEHLQCWNIFL